MDPRLNDPKFQVEIAKKLTGTSALERRVAHQFLQRSGIDVKAATENAKKWKAAQPIPEPAK
jgi:endonuclease V-like protein UPF0215 family